MSETDKWADIPPWEIAPPEPEERPKQTMFEIAEQIQAVAVALAESEVETPGGVDGLNAELERLIGTDLARKTDGFGWTDNELEHKILALKKERDGIDGKIQSLTRARKRIREILAQVIRFLGVPSIKGAYTTITVQGGKESLDVFDPNLVPAKYLIQVTTTDNEAIKRDLCAGKSVPGARLKTGDDFVNIDRTKKKGR